MSKEGRRHKSLQTMERKESICARRRQLKMTIASDHVLGRLRAVNVRHIRLHKERQHNNSMGDILTRPFAVILKFSWLNCALSGSIG